MTDTHLKFYSSNGKRRILIVEDEPINQEILKQILQEDYEVITAASGGEALDVLRTQYDTLSIILLDLNLPDMHGSKVLLRVKSDHKYAAIPVIVMTADSDAEVECLNLGAIDFIPKPYPRQKVILARIKRTIELSEDRDILRWTERDHLTGLYNKEFFYHYAFQFDMFHKDVPTDAVVLDINRFHIINDRYGKAYGDEILKRIADRALKFFANSDGIVCRSVADTFLIYCLHREDYSEMHEAFSAVLNDDEDSDNRVRLRMGVYSEADKSLDIERRFDRAKMAADTVRGSFTNVIGCYDRSLHESEILAEQLIEDFPAAIRDKQFTVFYQPKYDVTHDEPVLNSAEALVRWNHPTLGFISPAEFIPLFENNGLVQELDNYVWSQAAAQIKDWKERLDFSVPVSVNVSRIDLYDPELIDKLERLTEDNRLDRSELHLEITESAYTDDAKQIAAKSEQLRKLGYKIEMDDFGTGYSSLCMLSDLPIDALKLDMQFIRSAFCNRKDTRLLEAMIRLAATFEVPTIAEGVETAEQMLALKAMGCDMIQGYYFSPPVPADKFEAFLIKEKTLHTKEKDEIC